MSGLRLFLLGPPRLERDGAPTELGRRKALAEIYDWFTEGFDMVDLREAKALLEALY